VTVRATVALVNPAEDAVTLALPIVLGVKLDDATPPLAATGDAGTKLPDTPTAENEMVLVAPATVLPNAS
jgi:hypothetical protein